MKYNCVNEGIITMKRKDKKEKLTELKKQVKLFLEPFDEIEIEACAAHFLNYLKIHKDFIKNNTYGEIWKILYHLKHSKSARVEDKCIVEYGLELHANILYPEEEDELTLVENLISYINLTKHFLENSEYSELLKTKNNKNKKRK